MTFTVKKVCEHGIRVVQIFDNYEAALAKATELELVQEFSECFIDIEETKCLKLQQ